MKKLNSIFFLLFLLLVTGGFATIAQNAYGIDLLGWSVAGFGFFSFLGMVSAYTDKRYPKMLSLEYLSLTILFAIISMRIFLIRFLYIEWVFSSAGIILILVYIIYILRNFATLRSENKQLFLTLSMLYLSIATFTLAIVLNPISNYLSEIVGLLGLIIFILALMSKFRIKSIIVKDKEVSLNKYISILPNRAYLLLALFLLITIYTSASLFDFIPKLQASNMPKGYYELVKEAEAGTDISVDGQYRYQLYREHMDKFIKKQGLDN